MDESRCSCCALEEPSGTAASKYKSHPPVICTVHLTRAHSEAKSTVTCRDRELSFEAMSAEQIIDELPKLTAADLRAIRRRLMELAEQNEEVAGCDAMALEGAQMLDRMEQRDAGR